MTKNILLIFLIFTLNKTNAQSFKWAQKESSTSTDYAHYVMPDNGSNVFLTGYFESTITFQGTGAPATRSLTSNGQKDVYLVKKDCNRNLVWKNQIGSIGNDAGDYAFNAVKYDNKAHIYLTGTIAGNTTFSTTNGSPINITGTGGYDIFLAKYDTNGVLKWAVKSGSNANDEAMDCFIDKAGNILICGYFRSTATFGTTSGATITKVSNGAEDLFMAKYDSLGKLLWVNTAGSNVTDVATSIAADNQNNVYLGGNFANPSGTTTFGSLSISNTGSWGAYIAKATESGNWIWLNGMGGNASEGINYIAVDENCDVYVTGNFAGGNTNFSSSPPGTSLSLINIGGFDLNVAALDSSGVLKWVKALGSSGTEYGWHISTNKNTNILTLSGYFTGTTNLGNGNIFSSSGLGDGYICFLDKLTGSTVNALRIGGTGEDHSFCTTPDKFGNLYNCGLFSNIASFGTNSLTSSGAEDSYFAKLAPTAPFKLKPTNTSICSGDSILLQPLDSMVGISFQWFRNNIAIAGANKFTYYAKTSGTYKLKVTNNCSEIDSSEEITLTVTNISVNAGIDATICRGDSVQLTASGATFYYWTPSLSLSNVNIFNPIAKPTDTINYIVRGISGTCIAYDTVKINTKPILAQAGSDSTICNGDSIRLNGSAIGTFIWENNAFLSDSNALNTFIKPNITSNFILKVTNLGCTRRDTVKITVNSPTAFAGIDKTICLGDSILLNGTGNGNLKWSPKNNLTDTSNIVTYTKPNINSTYYLTATIGRCVQRDTIQILVNQVFVQLDKDTSICKGDSIQLNATAIGSFLWQTNPSLNNPNQLSPFVKPQTTTLYILEATSGTCTKRDSINITVFAPISNASTDQTICLGDSTQLNGTGYNLLKWYPKSGLTDSLTANTYAKPNVTTNYVLLAQDGRCFARDTVKINVTQIAANAGANKGICPGDSIQLNGSATGSFYWETKAGLNNTNILNPFVKPSISTYYVLTSIAGSCIKHDTVDVTVSAPLTLNAGTNLAICFGDSVRLNATGGFNYIWINATNISDTTVSNPFVKPNTTTDYIVKSGFSTCTYYDTVNVLVRPLPLVDAGIGGQICENDSFLLNGSGQGVAKWNPSIFVTDSNAFVTYTKPSSTTTFYLTSNNGFCKNTDSVKVIINNIIPINAGIDQTICENDTAILSVLGSTQIRWLNPQYLTDSTILITKAFPPTTTEFIAKSFNTACPSFDTIKVIVKEKPIIDAGLDTTICIGTNYQLKGIATKGDIFNWEPALLVSNPNILDPNITTPKTGFYKLTVQNSNGNCKTADSVKITLDSAIADFNANVTNGFIPLTVQFTNKSSNAAKYIWNFESNITSTQTSPSYTFENVGTYNVVLTAISKFGCIDTASLTIISDGEIIIQIPNVFTPNGDNLNDIFENKVNNLKFLQYLNGTIWNRWGQLIYEYQMPNGKWWDGKYEGNDCQEGVYFYIITAEGTNGQKFNFHGTVTLIR